MRTLRLRLGLLILPLIFAFVFFSFRQTINIDKLSEQLISLLEAYVNEMPEEKVFLHLDKGAYAAGDNIWFSVYLTAGSPDVPSPLSKVVYVDLLDEAGNLYQQKTIRIDEGHGIGDFKLDQFTREGVYTLKAYSYWQRGFGEDAVFSQSIQILEPYNLKFQPEVRWKTTGNPKHLTYNAEIEAFDKELQPISQRKIYYQLLKGAKQIKSGEFVTEETGKFDLSLQIEANLFTEAIFLRLELPENEDYKIIRDIMLPFPESSLDIQFLPEGGDLVEGLNNKVAVRSVYPDGTPVKINGQIVTETETIEFNTNSEGLGVFSFVPGDREYEVIVEVGSNKIIKKLPKVKSAGINLAVDNRNASLLNILIQAKDYNKVSSIQEALIVVHARGRIGHMQKLDLQREVAGVRINKSQLAPGINQITVFSAEGKPLAERLAYIPFGQASKIKLEANQVNIAPRGKNNWKLEFEDDTFEGGNYSISITDFNEDPLDQSSNIISYLKLESELKGKINQPKRLFNGGDQVEEIDLIMLTHGWRRFNWESLIQKQYVNPNYIEQGINIIGTVQPKNAGKRTIAGGTINVFSRGNEEEFIQVEFSENGKFILDDMIFQDTTRLTLQANDRRLKKSLSIELDPPLSKYLQWQDFSATLIPYKNDPMTRQMLMLREKNRQASAAFDQMDLIEIDEFILKSTILEPEKEEIQRVYGRGDVSLRPADIPGAEGYFDIWQLLQGRLAGVQIKPNPMGPPSVTIRGTGSFNAVSPIFLLDNVPVDATVISSVSPRDVALVEVFKDGASLAIFGSGGAGGAIAVYTRRASGISEEAEGVFQLNYPGYSTAREYYMPRYDKETSAKPDFRATLYWSPKLKFSGKTAEISFFNNDFVEKYKVVVQGIDKNGRLAYLEQIVKP
jgi:hypothetical protein